MCFEKKNNSLSTYRMYLGGINKIGLFVVHYVGTDDFLLKLVEMCINILGTCTSIIYISILNFIINSLLFYITRTSHHIHQHKTNQFILICKREYSTISA